MSVVVRPCIEIPDDAWVKTGHPENPAARLLSAIEVNGLALHFEAWAVHVDKEGVQQADFDPEAFDQIYAGVGDESSWDTVTINGREYVFIAYPMS